jgi:hypothetical protein
MMGSGESYNCSFVGSLLLIPGNSSNMLVIQHARQKRAKLKEKEK